MYQLIFCGLPLDKTTTTLHLLWILSQNKNKWLAVWTEACYVY